MATIQRISPCLWFANEAEDAALYYTGIFKSSRITTITRYGTAGFETHHRPAGSGMTVAFELDGQSFTALNGGPLVQVHQAGSFPVDCAAPQQDGYHLGELTSGGGSKARAR